MLSWENGQYVHACTYILRYSLKFKGNLSKLKKHASNGRILSWVPNIGWIKFQGSYISLIWRDFILKTCHILKIQRQKEFGSRYLVLITWLSIV